MQYIFHQNAFADIQSECSKLITYSLFKISPGYESYLSDIHIIEERPALTKFWLSNHLLTIEKDRHLKVERLPDIVLYVHIRWKMNCMFLCTVKYFLTSGVNL